MIIRFALLLTMLLQACILSGQRITQTVISSYGVSYGDGFTIVSSTMGENVIQTVSDGSWYKLTQGFHQPPLKITPDYSTSNSVEIFPNPVSDNVSLKVQFLVHDVYHYHIAIVDLFGRIQKTYEVEEAYDQQIIEFNLTGLAQGMYLIHVYSEDGSLIRTEKVDKL